MKNEFFYLFYNVKEFVFLSGYKKKLNGIQIPEFMINDIYQLCTEHNNWFERCRTNFLEANPNISDDDNYSFPLTNDVFEIKYNTSTKLWHGDREWEEETDTLTHYLFFDSQNFNVNFIVLEKNNQFEIVEAEEEKDYLEYN